jgi:hypothetical protein
VTAIILHPDATTGDDPLVRAVSDARAALAERHRTAFLAAGARDARIVHGPPDGRPFGARLRALAAGLPADEGLVVLGSGAVPLATRRHLVRFVAAAARGEGGQALANNRFSADIVAIPSAASTLADLPDLASDNVLPRWLHETAGLAVEDRAGDWRLAMDVDVALDLVVLGGRWRRWLPSASATRVEDRIEGVRATAADLRAELTVAGRTSPATISWLRGAVSARVRALIEERGLRAATAGQRPPASVLGRLLDEVGPAALGAELARLGEAAVVDTRVLLAHHHGPDPSRWPPDADRFASDLLLHERVADPWLQALTRSAAEAPIPVLLGAHSLVGPGLRLLLAPRRRATGAGTGSAAPVTTMLTLA